MGRVPQLNSGVSRTAGMDLALLQAHWMIGTIPPEAVPDAAIALLEAGVDTPAIRELAGLIRPVSAEVHPVLERVFEESNLPSISADEAGWRVAFHTARQITTGQISPRAGASRLWGLWGDLDHPDALSYFVYLAADYGEGPKDPVTEAQWFDDRIRETAQALLRIEPTHGRSSVPEAAG